MDADHIRHVWRELNDGNGDVKVLALQVFTPAEEWMHVDIVAAGGYWSDVPVVTREEGLVL